MPEILAHAASVQIQPGRDQTVKITAALTGPTSGTSSNSGCLLGDDPGDLVAVVGELTIQLEDPFGQSDRLGACSRKAERLVAASHPAIVAICRAVDARRASTPRSRERTGIEILGGIARLLEVMLTSAGLQVAHAPAWR